MSTYTRKNLSDVEDSAVKFGFDDGFSARFAREDLDCERTGFSLQRLDPGRRSPFGHRHDDAEEVYVVLGGGGRMLLDEEAVEVRRLDAIRVSPGVVRSFEAGDEGLEVLVFGPHIKGDGTTMQVDWPEA
ncbi:MAG: Cupin 2 conserved barrel domain protein [Solirubrobacterales bacterium]|nr:Cupin 2 conserved barrel domain protein [Solirubrobacterales bacterium]